MNQQLQTCKYFLDPGYVALSSGQSYLYSVCGNGIVVTLWDPLKRVGGMAHCIFPGASFGEPSSNYHADTALVSLISSFKASNCRIYNIQAQLFGGGDLRGHGRKRARLTVSAIRKVLKRFGIYLVSEDLGGSIGRKIAFDTFSGEILIYKTNKVRMTDWAPEYLINSNAR